MVDAPALARLFEDFPYKRPHLVTALQDSTSASYVSASCEPAAGVVCHPAGHVFLAGEPTCSGVWQFVETQLAQREDPRRPLMLISAGPAWDQAISDRMGQRACTLQAYPHVAWNGCRVRSTGSMWQHRSL